MTAKIGRPKSDTAMHERVTVRLDKATKEHLLRYCLENKVDKTEAVRRGIKNLPINRK